MRVTTNQPRLDLLEQPLISACADAGLSKPGDSLVGVDEDNRLIAAKREPYHMVTGSCLPSVESGMQMLRVRMSVIFTACTPTD